MRIVEPLLMFNEGCHSGEDDICVPPRRQSLIGNIAKQGR